MAALGIAWVNNSRPLRVENLVIMDVTQGPVVNAGLGELRDRAGRISSMLRVATNVAMEKAN